MMALAYCSTSYLFYGLNNRNWREKKLRQAFSFFARRKSKKKQLMTLAYCSTSHLFLCPSVQKLARKEII
jgi:hypothetical protein